MYASILQLHALLSVFQHHKPVLDFCVIIKLHDKIKYTDFSIMDYIYLQRGQLALGQLGMDGCV
jgi:hypothetical protein